MNKKLFDSIISVLILLVVLCVTLVLNSGLIKAEWVEQGLNNTFSITTPVNASYISQRHLAINFTVSFASNSSNANITNVSWYYKASNATSWTIFGSMVNGTGNKTIFSFNTTVAWPAGVYTINATGWSTIAGAGPGEVESLAVNVSVDRTNPLINLQFPRNYTNSTASTVSFFFNATDSLTEFALNISNCTLYLYKSGAWELNTTRLLGVATNGGNQSINITLEDGFFLWKVGCYDRGGNQGNSTSVTGGSETWYNLTVDVTAPSASSIELPKYENVFATESIKIKCTGGDPTIGLKYVSIKITKPSKKTVTKNVHPPEFTAEFKGNDINEAGEYKVDCTVVDNLDHTTSATQRTFHVFFSDTGGEEEGAAEEEKPADVVISTVEQYSGLVGGKQGESKTFTLDDATVHTITFLEVSLTSAKLKIESEPVEITLDVGKFKTLDLDGDGSEDTKITLTSIEEGLAKIELINLIKQEEKITGITKEEPEIPTAEEEVSRAGLWITVLIILVIIVIGYFVLKKRKGKRGEVKFSRRDLGL